MKRPMFFHAAECGCQGGSQSGYATPVIPNQQALIADNRYFTLATSPKVQILGVPLGSNTQAFLKPATPVNGGFVQFGSDGQAFVAQQPVVSIPSLNPPSVGVYPEPDAWKHIVIATGADPATWFFLTAPTAGTFILQSSGGQFQLVDSTSIPGINDVGQSAGLATKGQILVIVPGDDDNEYVVKKLTVTHNRVIVGDIDDDGISGYKVLPDASDLFHPKGKFTGIRFRTLEGLDPDGNSIVNGFEEAVTTGAGAVTDGVRLVYSPSRKQLFKAPERGKSFTKNATTSSSLAAAVTYQNYPGGHATSPSVQINYPTVLIVAQLIMTADATHTVGLFRDGVLLSEFVLVTADQPTFSYVDTNVTLGAHVYDLRFKKTGSTASTVVVAFSSILVVTLD